MATQALPSAAPSVWSRLLNQSDAVMAMAVVLIVAMMIIPLPTPLLDLLLIANITGALTILLLAMYTREPLEFSVFPSLLLLTTLFRLGLNVSSTRLILLNGHAGEVIRSFGNFVVGGNYVVGIVVFLILVVIQFVVITNGAARVAEVAARFTLDAMPGKQMSIDADLNAGLINEGEARARRRAIAREADFYGAMDGASKFVKGDAIAGVVIIVVNIVGGFAIGVLQRGQELSQALQTYTLLTVGDGLVTQLPALMISTATGLIVTRAASDAHLAHDTVRQLSADPRGLGIVGLIIAGFGLVPGLPTVPFLVIGSLVLGWSRLLQRMAKGSAEAAASRAQPATGPTQEAENLMELLHVDPLEIEVGYDLIPLVDAEAADNLLDRITRVRRQLALEMGIILPKVRIRDNLQLEGSTYVVKLRGVEIGRGSLLVGHHLAIAGSSKEPLEGVSTTEPAFGLPATWVIGDERQRAELLGYAVVDPISVATTHLTELIRTHAPSILSRQDVQTLLTHAKEQAPAVVEELVPGLLSLGEVQKVLQNLLRERVSVRDLVSILEALANGARVTRDTELLTDMARQALGRSIASQHRDVDGALHAVTLGPRAEQALAAATQQAEHGLVVALDPRLSREMVQRAAAQIQQVVARGHQPVLLCSARVRRALRSVTERALPALPVLSYSEMASEFQVTAEGTVEVDHVD